MVDKATQAHIEIDGRDFALGEGRDVHDVMSSIEAAAASPPAFVHLSEGEQMIAVLIHSRSRVVVTVGQLHGEYASPESWESFPDWDL